MRTYLSSSGERDAEYGEMLEFLLHIKREMKSFLKTPSEICESFRGSVLSERGVLSNFAGGKGEKMFDGSLMKKEDKDMLMPFFARFGMGLYESELESLSDIIAVFRERVGKMREESEKKRKLTPVIFVFVFASLVLMLL